MKRLSDENPTAANTKKYKSRWDVGPNDVENKGVQPTSDIEKKIIQPTSIIEKKIIQPKSDIGKKRIQPKNDAQQKTRDYHGQVNIGLFFPSAPL